MKRLLRVVTQAVFVSIRRFGVSRSKVALNYREGFHVELDYLTVGHLEPDELGDGGERGPVDPDERVAVQFELAQLRHVDERVAGHGAQGVVAQVELDEVREAGERGRVDVAQRAPLQDHALQVRQAQSPELVRAQRRQRVPAQVQHLRGNSIKTSKNYYEKYYTISNPITAFTLSTFIAFT